MKKQIVCRNPHDSAQVESLVRELISVQPVKVTIEDYRKKRSLDQNALYWLWMTVIRDHIRDTIGSVYTTDDLHEWFRDAFLGKRTIEFKDRALVVPRSTTTLNVQEMTDYLNNIEMYCADRLNLILPIPEAA